MTPVFTVVIPPPNVTDCAAYGLHARMKQSGYSRAKAKNDAVQCLLVPGSDHASIATEAKVVQIAKRKRH